MNPADEPHKTVEDVSSAWLLIGIAGARYIPNQILLTR
jgi:hypothetical protein